MAIHFNDKTGRTFFKRISLLFFYLLVVTLLATLIVDFILTFNPIIYRGKNDVAPNLIPTIILMPIIEELSFRLLLTNKAHTLKLGLSFFLGFLLSSVFSTYSDSGYLSLTIIFILSSIVFNFILSRVFIPKEEVVDVNQVALAIVMSILFAYVHFVFTDPWIIIRLEVLYLLPHFFRSLIYSYARMTYGIKYAILLHVAFNLFITSLSSFA